MDKAEETGLGRYAWSARHGKAIDAADLRGWAEKNLQQHEASLQRLLAVKGQRTADNTWRPYDDAVALLSTTASECSLLDSVYPEKAIRDTAQQLAQRAAEAATALSLNQDVYRALARGRSLRRRPRHPPLRRTHAAAIPAGRCGQG